MFVTRKHSILKALPCFPCHVFYELREEINEDSDVHGLRKKKNAVKNFLTIGQINSKTDDYLVVTFIKWS